MIFYGRRPEMPEDGKKPEEKNLPYNLMDLPHSKLGLEDLGEVIRVPKNTALNTEGQIPDCCYIVKSGRVICYEFTYTGEMRVYNFLEPGITFMEEFMLLDKPCPVLFKTVVPTELVRIGKCDLKRAFKHDIDIVMDVCESLATKFVSSMEQIRYGNQRNATWKLCKLLLIFAEHYGVPYDGKVLIDEKLSQQMLADLLGMNRVTVTRKLKELKDLALVEQINGYYCVRSLEQLKAHMDASGYQWN